MSKVRKLSIRGIRNFSDTEEATIRFSCPLTLITGLNGVGKTTIIECLRYITTGEFPPGSDRGRSFIHDPMLKKQTSVQVRGCVKGEFVDREGKTITVTRTIECTRFEKTTKFKTLDNAVSVYNPKTGKSTQLTNRCADIDVEVMHSLGVSKAILNHVIFCHQDDANWPLDENKVIKDRFDAILETTNYNKALENLRKLAKSKETALKIAQVEEARLADRVIEIRAKEEKLNEFKQRKSDVEERIRRINSRLEPINERLRRIREIEVEFNRLRAEDEKDKVAYNMAREQCESLQLRVKEMYEGSDEELREEIESYGSTLQQKTRKIAGIEGEIRDLLRKEQSLSKVLGEHRVLMGTLRQQMEDQGKRTKERNQALNAALAMWGLQALEDFESDYEVQRGIEAVESKTKEFERSIADKRMKQNQGESELEKTVEAARDKRSKINSELERSEKDAEEIRKTIMSARLKIGQADDSGKRLDAVDAKLVQMDKEIEEINELMRSEDVEDKITRETRKFEEIEEKFTELDEEMTLIQNQSALNVKLESLKSNSQAKSKDIEQLKSQHEENIKKLLKMNRVPEYNLKETIEEAQRVLSERLERLSKEIKTKEYELMAVETALTHAKKELNVRIMNNECEKEKVKAHCEDYTKYEEVLLDQQTKLKELQDKRGMIAHQGSAYQAYIREFSRNSCCALCERGFDSQSEAQKLLNKLKKGIADHPDLLRRCERELNVEQGKYNTLLSIKSAVEAITKFEAVDKEEMTKKIKLKEQEASELKQKITELKESKLEPERRIEMVKSMIPDLTIWDRYSQDLLQIDIAMDELQEEMSSRGRTSNKTMGEIQTERESLKKSLKETRDKIDELRSTLDIRKEQLRRATERRTKCLEEQLRIHNEAQQLRKLKDDLKEMITRESALRSSLQGLRQQLMAADEERGEVVRELDELKFKNQEEQEIDRKLMKDYEKQWDTLNALQGEIARFASRNVKKQLENLELEVKLHQKNSEEKQRERSDKERELIQIKEDISCHETKKRNLTDNVELRKYQKTLRQLEQSRKQRSGKINLLNYDEVVKEHEELVKEIQEAEGEINKASGIRGEITKSIDQLTEDLNTKECKTARTAHRAKCIEVFVTRQAIDDVMAFAKVLDVATAEFHEERLDKINSAMKKLWKLIYSGNDTKSIQIRAEATSTCGVTEKRQFNYKLVQIKHGIEMEMRGRCSAGQRVLASIILRLALAETLSQQCGVLALDEPTTNLDAVNSAKLADALYRYVTYRAKYEKNFQLIVITHDENFIRNLSELGSQNFAQELYRMDNGLTSVRKSKLNNGDDVEDAQRQNEPQNEPETQQSMSRKRALAGDGPPGKRNRPYNFELDF
ncbi:DNA repair protein RAD50 [Diachasma alloeum]|uniref:DNA repair protein RAD50 n=1 Tax=Diachasma alloeum TaxID=454923 RepID=UPI0007384C9C|nr:DNA repair protein RAD50 [Diachasma alloeum]